MGSARANAGETHDLAPGVKSFPGFLPIGPVGPIRLIRPICPVRLKRFRNTLEGYPVLGAVRTGIPEGTEPLAGGKRSATFGG